MTRNALAGASSATNATSYNTAAFAPSANALALAFVGNAVASGTATQPSLSGGGMTSWELIDTITQGVARLSVFRAMQASPGASAALVISFGAVTQDLCFWSVFEYTDADRSGGANGAGAIVQNLSSNNGGSSGTSFTLAHANPFARSTNISVGGILLGWFNNTDPVTPGAGFSEIHDLENDPGIANGGTLETEDRTGDFDPSWSWATSSAIRAIALEISIGTPLDASAILAATAALAASGFVTRRATAALTATAALAASADVEGHLKAGTAALAASAALAAVGRVTYGAAAALGGSAAILPTASVFSVLLEGRQPKNVLFHVYTSAGVVIRTWPDVSGYPVFEYPINSGPGTMQVRLPRPWGAAGEPGETGSAGDIQHGNLVKVYVLDRESGVNGILIWQGTIEDTVCDLAGQIWSLTLVPKTSQLNDAVIHEPLTFVATDPTNMVKYLIDNDVLPGMTWDATNPLVGTVFDLTFERGKVSQFLEVVRGLAGGLWYLRLNADNSLTFNKWSTKVATHELLIGRHVAADVKFVRSSLEVKKRVYFYGDGVVGEASTPGYDPGSAPYDLAVSNPRVTDGELATRLAATILESRQVPTIATELTVIDGTLDLLAGYDIESIKPGHTIALLNSDDVFAFGKWDGAQNWGSAAGIWGGTWNQQIQHPYVVVSVRYGFVEAEIKLASLPILLPTELVNLQDAVFLAGAR